MSKKRSDIHRPGAIIPADYESKIFYCGSKIIDGTPMPPYNVNLVHALKKSEKFFSSSIFQCDICGSHFNEGEVWKHKSGEHICIGHQCAEKYGMMADWSEQKLEQGRIYEAHAKVIQAHMNKEKREDFLKENPSLEEALKFDHHIIKDIARRFQTNCYLSEKQIALVFKLAEEAKNPSPIEKKIPAPEGKVTFQGDIVSVKWHDGMYGSTLKMTVKVKTDDGVWMAWGTVPNNMMDAASGDKVEITATLAHGDDNSFSFFKRPKAKIIKGDE